MVHGIWLADYFGLPSDFQSTIRLAPSIKNVIVDFSFYWGLDNCYEGMYFRVHAPLVHAQWKLDYCEDVINEGIQDYNAGYFAPNIVPRQNLLRSFEEYISEGKVPTLNSGVFFESLRFSKWAVSDCNRQLKTTRLSDIQLVLGWNYRQCEDYHLGINARASIPTGTRPKGEFLFEPVIGNGHHWEFGAGLTSHYTFWNDCECDQSLGAYVDLNVTHLFKTRQCRNFDLCNSPSSRYMLAERLGKPVESLAGSTLPITNGNVAEENLTSATEEFKSIFTPVANLTQSRVKVSAGIQLDLTTMLSYESGCYNFDFGYNLWYRGCEKISRDCSCPSPLENQQWGLKGDAQVFGFPLATGCTDNEGQLQFTIEAAEPLSATESKANIFAGTNRPCEEPFNDPTQRRNPNVDNAQFAYQTDETIALLSSPNQSFATTCDEIRGDQTKTSIQPKFILPTDVDCSAARTKGLTHKIFGNYSYAWNETECGWIPYCGIGAKAEFSARGDTVSNSCDEICINEETCFTTPTCETSCKNSCRQCALSEWGIWIKGGAAFN